MKNSPMLNRDTVLEFSHLCFSNWEKLWMFSPPRLPQLWILAPGCNLLALFFDDNNQRSDETWERERKQQWEEGSRGLNINKVREEFFDALKSLDLVSFLFFFVVNCLRSHSTVLAHALHHKETTTNLKTVPSGKTNPCRKGEEGR